MNHVSLFSGIGGFDLAGTWVWGEDFHSIAHSEIEKYPCQVYHRHFPESECLGDITKVDWRRFRGSVDLVTGGFPCQPFSVAGKRRGKGDDRYLWPAMLEAIRGIRPRYVLAENVPGLDDKTHLALDQTISDLEGEGYEVAPPFWIPALAVGAWHRRERIWIVAHTFDNELGTGARSIREEDEIQGIYREKVRGGGIGGTDRVAQNTEHGRQSHGEQEEQGSIGNERDTGTGDGKRLRVQQASGNPRGSGFRGDSRRWTGQESQDGLARSERDAQHPADNTESDELPVADTKKQGLPRSGHKSGKQAPTERFGVEHNNSFDSNTLRDRSQGKWQKRNDKRPPGLYGGENGWETHWLEVAAEFCRVDDGLPPQLDRVQRLKALGNAIVPQVAKEIFQAIKEIEDSQ